MKKLAFALIALCLAIAPAAFADWKKEPVSNVIATLDGMAEKVKKGDEDIRNLLSYQRFVISAVHGMCLGFVEGIDAEAPEALIARGTDMQVATHQGKAASSADIRSYITDCLTHVEKTVIESGLPREQFEESIAPLIVQSLELLASETF